MLTVLKVAKLCYTNYDKIRIVVWCVDYWRALLEAIIMLFWLKIIITNSNKGCWLSYYCYKIKKTEFESIPSKVWVFSWPSCFDFDVGVFEVFEWWPISHPSHTSSLHFTHMCVGFGSGILYFCYSSQTHTDAFSHIKGTIGRGEWLLSSSHRRHLKSEKPAIINIILLIAYSGNKNQSILHVRKYCSYLWKVFFVQKGLYFAIISITQAVQFFKLLWFLMGLMESILLEDFCPNEGWSWYMTWICYVCNNLKL